MKLHKFIGLLGAALFISAMTGCSDDDSVTPLDKSDMIVDDATYSSLTFRWGKVDGARQYSYQFAKSGSSNILETGLTKDNHISFTGLDHDTEYTLTVLAYAAVNSDHTTSEPIVLSARTTDLTTLESPQPAWLREANTVIVQWQAVDGARDYSYTLTDADGNEIDSGSTYDTSVNFTQFATGQYTFSLVAQTTQEGYRNSAPAQISIDFTREREELWRTAGKYTSALLNDTWDATLVAYDDNSYTLLAWYGTDGYNLEFSVDQTDANDMFRLGSEYTYDSATDTYSVPTGLTSPASVGVQASGNRCAMEGNAGKGSVVLAVSSGSTSGTDRFVWGVSIDDFIGEWNLSAGMLDAYDSSYDEYYTSTVTVSLGSAPNTLVIPLPNYYGYVLGSSTIVVDLDSMTFTMQPFSFGNDAWILSGADSSTTPITGTISANKIEFSGFQAWYGEYDYLSSDSYITYTR